MNFISEIYTSVWLTLIAVFAILLLIQLIYYWFVFGKLAFYNETKRAFNNASVPISIIICANNEYNNLVNKLPRILEQEYSCFEVIVVNNASDDDTLYLLNELSKIYPHLRIVNIPQDLNFFKGKKFPLSIGIKTAQYDKILLTDADCFPNSNQWLQKMQSAFTQNIEVVIGYSSFNVKSGLLNKFIRYDNFINAVKYLSFALLKFPYTAVGRNLAYEKKLFFDVGGFIKHYKITYGDDNLLVNKIANSKNTRIQINKDTFVYSEAKNKFSTWLYKHRKISSTVNLYKFKHAFFLKLYSLSQVLFYVIATLLLLLSTYYKVVIVFFILRIASQIIVMKKAMNKLNEKYFLFLIPFFEIFTFFINFYIAIHNAFTKKTQW